MVVETPVATQGMAIKRWVLALCSVLGHQALSLPALAEEDPLVTELVIKSQLCARQKTRH